MNTFKISLTNDEKEKDQSFEAKAVFDYRWGNSWNGYGGNFELVAFGKTEEEAKVRLVDEILTFHSEIVKAISRL